MTVRFKCQSEYQKSYRVSRSRSVSPQRCTPLAGLRSDQMGIIREPRLQRRRRPGPVGPARSCSSLLHLQDVQHSVAEPQRRAPSAVSRSRSAHREAPPLDPRPPTPPGANPGSPAEPETPAGPRPAVDPGPPERPDPVLTAADRKSAKPRPSRPDSQSQPSRPLTAAPDEQQQDDPVLWRKAGLRPGGQKSGGQRSEYHREFGWKKPAPAASPILTAEQVLYSSSRSVPPFKTNPVPMDTEYRRSFQGVAPPTGPRLWKHLEHQRVPLFHTHTTTRRRREEPQKKLRPEHEVPLREDATSQSPPKATPPPPPLQVQRGYRMLTEYQSSFRSPLYRNLEGGGATDGDAHQLKELREKAASYRHRAWGVNFSRDHLNQLLSEHNALWEPADTTDSPTDPPSPRHLTFDPSPEPHGRRSDGSSSDTPPGVEALDLVSNSSKTSSVVTNKKKQGNMQTAAQSPPGPPAERRTAWGGGEEEEEEENTDDDEGRLPTPRLKTRPVQRTHHDLTTPATGGAILVGKVKNADDSPANKQRSGSNVSSAAGAEPAVHTPVKLKQVWSEISPAPSEHKPASSLASKPIRTKQTPPPPAAPPPLVPPPPHCIQGTLRHPDFQHNGELGLRFRDLPCSGGCGSDEDDRLSVMSWRSAASCSMASAVLERAQKRRENFWGKR